MSAPSRRTRPLPPGWRKIRAAALERDGHACQWPRDGGICGAPAAEVDHIRSAAEGGDDDLSNLMSMCRPCHAHKTGISAGRAGGLANGVIRREIASRKVRPPERHPGLRREG